MGVVSVISVLFTGALAVSAQADEGLIACEIQSGNVSQRCVTVERELVPELDFEADVTIEYKFSCRGHPIGAVFASGGGDKPVEFGGDGFVTVNLTGRGPFGLVERDATRTYRATLLGDCRLTIREGYPKHRPSIWQLGQWKEAASDAAVLVEDALDYLRLVKDLGDVIAWDDERLTAQHDAVERRILEILPGFGLSFEELVYREGPRQGELKDAADLPRSWQRATIRYPELPWLVALKAQTSAIKGGRPPVYAPQDEVDARRELTERLSKAGAIIRRADEWSMDIDAEMSDLVEELKRLRAEAHGEVGDQ